MKPVGNFIKTSLNALKADRALELHRLKAAWLEAVGPFIAHQTRPVKIRGDALCLVVGSPAWAQEVKLQQRTILERLRRALPDLRIGKLICWVGELEGEHTPLEVEPELEEDIVPWRDLPIPPEREESIEKSIAGIGDQSLKEKMRQLYRLSVRRELYLLDQGQLPCPLCGQLRPSEEKLCAPCRREQKEELERKIMRLLKQKPWLTAQDVFDQTPLKDRSAFLTIRKRLLGNLMLSAWQRTEGLTGKELADSMDDDLRQLLLEITMLRCSLAPHRLASKHFYFALGKRLAEAYLGS